MSTKPSKPGFWKSPRHTSRSVLLLAPVFLIVVVLATVVHEFGHLLAAEAFGQQVASFNPFAEVMLVNPPPAGVETIFNYSGGLFSALVFAVAALILFRKPRGPSLFWLGIPLMFAVILELSNGLMEGAFKRQYIIALVFNSNSEGTWLSAWAAGVSIVFAVGAYYFVSKMKRQQEWTESVSGTSPLPTRPARASSVERRPWQQ